MVSNNRTCTVRTDTPYLVPYVRYGLRLLRVWYLYEKGGEYTNGCAIKSKSCTWSYWARAQLEVPKELWYVRTLISSLQYLYLYRYMMNDRVGACLKLLGEALFLHVGGGIGSVLFKAPSLWKIQVVIQQRIIIKRIRHMLRESERYKLCLRK